MLFFAGWNSLASSLCAHLAGFVLPWWGSTLLPQCMGDPLMDCYLWSRENAVWACD